MDQIGGGFGLTQVAVAGLALLWGVLTWFHWSLSRTIDAERAQRSQEIKDLWKIIGEHRADQIARERDLAETLRELVTKKDLRDMEDRLMSRPRRASP